MPVFATTIERPLLAQPSWQTIAPTTWPSCMVQRDAAGTNQRNRTRHERGKLMCPSLRPICQCCSPSCLSSIALRRLPIAALRRLNISFPYDHPAEAVAEALQTAGLAQALLNMSPGDWNAGERGLAGLPGREADFEKAWTQQFHTPRLSAHHACT